MAERFELASGVYSFRCPCGTQEYAQSVNKRYAIALVGHFRTISPNAEGYYACDCKREFRWGSQLAAGID